MRKLLFVFFVAFLCVYTTDAQNFPMRHFGIEDGLPSNKVYEIYRDSKGFLWMKINLFFPRVHKIDLLLQECPQRPITMYLMVIWLIEGLMVLLY